MFVCELLEAVGTMSAERAPKTITVTLTVEQAWRIYDTLTAENEQAVRNQLAAGWDTPQGNAAWHLRRTLQEALTAAQGGPQ